MNYNNDDVKSHLANLLDSYTFGQIARNACIDRYRLKDFQSGIISSLYPHETDRLMALTVEE